MTDGVIATASTDTIRPAVSLKFQLPTGTENLNKTLKIAILSVKSYHFNKNKLFICKA